MASQGSMQDRTPRRGEMTSIVRDETTSMVTPLDHIKTVQFA